MVEYSYGNFYFHFKNTPPTILTPLTELYQKSDSKTEICTEPWKNLNHYTPSTLVSNK